MCDLLEFNGYKFFLELFEPLKTIFETTLFPTSNLE